MSKIPFKYKISIAAALIALCFSGCTPKVFDASVMSTPSACPGQSDAVNSKADRFAAPEALPPLPDSARAANLTPLQLGSLLVNESASLEAAGRAMAVDPAAEAERSVARNLGIDPARFKGYVVTEAGADRAEALLERIDLFQTKISSAMAAPGAGAGAGRSAVSGDGAESNAAGEVIVLSRQQWQDTFSDIVKTTSENGWVAAFERDWGLYRATGRSLDSNGRARAAAKAQRTWLIAAYMADYFRNGKVFALDLKQDSLKTALQETVNKAIPNRAKAEKLSADIDQQIDKLAPALQKELCDKGRPDDGPCRLLGVIGEQTFVTRAGKSYGFPGITATIDLVAGHKVSTNKIKIEDIAPDLVRVVFEASGDEISTIPGEKNSTLCRVRGLCSDDSTADKLQRVNQAGDITEATVTAAVGAAARGGWLGSLNNEVLANTITVGASVMARKIAEATTWHAVNRCTSGRSLVAPNSVSVTFRLTE